VKQLFRVFIEEGFVKDFT